MWRIQNELDFLIVKNSMLGIKDAVLIQMMTLAVVFFFFSSYVPTLYLGIWIILHLLNYAFRFTLGNFYLKLKNSQEHYIIASTLLRFYFVSLLFTSMLWGSTVLFFPYLSEYYHFLLYMLVFGFIFASFMAIGPIFSLFLAYTLPMSFITFGYIIFYEPNEYIVIGILMIMAFFYSLRASQTYFKVYSELISEKLNVEKALHSLEVEKNNQEQYLNAIEHMDLGTLLLDENGIIVQTNITVEKWFGSLKGKAFDTFLNSMVKTKSHRADKECITTHDDRSFEMVKRDIQANHDQHNSFVILKDITEDIAYHKILEQEKALYKHKSEHDPLTNLLNRESFIQILSSTLYEVDRTFSKIALLFIDIDDFKQINDTYGHEIGDTVLQVLSRRMHNSIRESDLACRYAGDEFLIALKWIEQREIVEQIVTKILYALSQPIKIDLGENRKKELYVTVSIGISIYPDDTKDIQQLINKADRAMYAIKSKKKNGYGFYSERVS